MRSLSPTRVRILKRLASRDLDRDGAETAREIATACEVRWAANALREMSFSWPRPLTRRLVRLPGEPRTWTITDAGRSALAASESPLT